MKIIKIFESKTELETKVLPFSIYVVNIESKSICLTQFKEEFTAFENKCPHYSVPLETGKINFKGEIVCSLHAYRFNLKNGWESDGKNLCLKRFSLDINESGVFINLP